MRFKRSLLFLIILMSAGVCLGGQELSLIEISEDEITLELDRIIKQNSLSGREIKEEDLTVLRENIKEGIIMRRLLVSLALYRGMAVSADEVDTAMSSTRGEYPEDEWQNILSGQGYTEESFRMVLEESLLIDRVLETEVLSDITISDKEVEDYYNNHKEDFTTDHGIIPFREVSALIKENLLTIKGQQEVSLFMDELYAKAMFVEKQ